MRDGIELRSWDGQLRTIDVPLPGEACVTAEKLFEQGCKAVAQELYDRHRGKGEKSDWVHLVCYEFLSRIVSYQQTFLFEGRIRGFGRDPKGSTQVNPFQRGLLAIFAHEPGLMDEGERVYYGKRLWYAYRHYVPACFVKGFLHQVWSKGSEGRVDSDHIVPGFEQWIWFERAADPHPELRGQYPAKLEEQVALIRKFAPIVNDAEQAKGRYRVTKMQLLEEEPFD